jgi:hypothetical protein
MLGRLLLALLFAWIAAAGGRAEVVNMSKGAAMCLGRIAETLATARSIKVLEVNEEALEPGVVGTDLVLNVVNQKGQLSFRTGSCKMRTRPGGELSIDEFFLPVTD